MARRLKIAEHLDEKELEARYRGCGEGVERSHWQIVWLLKQGQRTAEVSAVTGYSEQWIWALVKRYNAEGGEGLKDKRHTNPGRRRRLSAEQESALRQEVEVGVKAGQVWSGVDVARRLSEIVGQPMYAVRGWELLKRWGFRQKTPRPRHVKADKAEQDAFKKT